MERPHPALQIDYKISEDAAKDISENDDMLTSQSSTVVCLQKGQEYLEEQNKTFNLADAELSHTSKSVAISSSPKRHQNMPIPSKGISLSWFGCESYNHIYSE